LIHFFKRDINDQSVIKNTDMEAEVNIFTLNCWGLGLGISKNRDERMEDIGKYLSEQNYDIVFLQEVWKRNNFNTIKSLVSSVLPYSHFFDNGIIGTGTAIFTKVKIQDVTFHEFGLNGYPHKLLHGDWFGGKGLGVCQIDFRGFNIHLFVSHYHATYDYNPLTDVYLGHRVVHSVESAQWIKLSSSSADLTIYAGDFNTEPKDVPYQIVKYVTPLCDAWVEANGPEGGQTSETPYNTYTARSSLKESPEGKRIDYIMYNSGPNINASTVHCSLPLPQKIPGKPFSYSDHEGVVAKISIKRNTENMVSSRDFVRMQSKKDLNSKLECVEEGRKILINSLKSVKFARIMYLICAALCFLLLIVLFVPTTLTLNMYVGLDIVLFLLRLILIVAGTYLLLMSLLFFRKERHALNGTLACLMLLLDRGSEVETDAKINMYEQEGASTSNGYHSGEIDSIS